MTNKTFEALNVESLHTEHVDSDFDHFVSGRALSIDDVPAAVVQFALRDHDHRGCVGGVDLRGNTSITSKSHIFQFLFLVLTVVISTFSSAPKKPNIRQ